MTVKQWVLVLSKGPLLTAFHWAEGLTSGNGGWQLDSNIDEDELPDAYKIEHDGTSDFHGFVLWSFDCAKELCDTGYRFIC